MQFNIANPFCSTTYVRGFVNCNYEELKVKIKILSEDLSCDNDLIVYYLVKTLLDYDMFFKLKSSTYEDLFYNAAYWASRAETKQKNRPKSFNGVGDKKTERFFTKLTHSVMSALIIKHNISFDSDIHKSSMAEIKFNLELSEFLNLMFEISCVKRNRNNN